MNVKKSVLNAKSEQELKGYFINWIFSEYKTTFIQWIEPKYEETTEHYAQRLEEQIP